MNKPLPAVAKPSLSAIERAARSDRKGKKLIAGFYPLEASRAIRTIAAEHDTTVQEVLREFLNDGFAKYGKERVA